MHFCVSAQLNGVEHVEVEVDLIRRQQEVNYSLHIFLMKPQPKIYLQRLLVQLNQAEVNELWFGLDEMVGGAEVDGHSNVVAGGEADRDHCLLQARLCNPCLKSDIA